MYVPTVLSNMGGVLQAALDGVDVYDHRPRGTVNTPSVYCALGPTRYDSTFSADEERTFEVVCLVNPTANEDAQTRLWRFTAATAAEHEWSIPAALNNTTLSDAVDYLRVRSHSGLEVHTLGGTEYLGITFTVEAVG
jgi:hypothetical protein